MTLLFLLAALAQQFANPTPAPQPGGLPGNWLPLIGAPDLRYRWSLPMANSCSLEISDPTGSGPVRLQLSVHVYITPRVPVVVPSNPDSPMQVQPTRIPPREEDRTLSMQLFRMGFENRTIHDCYGIVRVRAAIQQDRAAPAPDSSSSPENPQ